MVIPITLILSGLGFLIFRTKEEVSLIDVDMQSENIDEENDLFKDLDDLFI